MVNVLYHGKACNLKQFCDWFQVSCFFQYSFCPLPKREEHEMIMLSGVEKVSQKRRRGREMFIEISAVSLNLVFPEKEMSGTAPEAER